MMYYSDEYLCHYGVLGMKWGQHIAARSQAKSAKRAAKAQRKADIADGKKHASYSVNRTFSNRHIAAKAAITGAIGAYTGGIMGAVLKTAGEMSKVNSGAAALSAINPVVLGVGIGVATAAYSGYSMKRDANDYYADLGSGARRGANYATDNMKYAKQVQDTADKYGIAARVKRVD